MRGQLSVTQAGRSAVSKQPGIKHPFNYANATFDISIISERERATSLVPTYGLVEGQVIDTRGLRFYHPSRYMCRLETLVG